MFDMVGERGGPTPAQTTQELDELDELDVIESATRTAEVDRVLGQLCADHAAATDADTDLQRDLGHHHLTTLRTAVTTTHRPRRTPPLVEPRPLRRTATLLSPAVSTRTGP